MSKISDDEYLAEIPSISHCMASGGTMEEASQNIKEVLDTMLEIMIEDGVTIPDDSNILSYSIIKQLHNSNVLPIFS